MNIKYIASLAIASCCFASFFSYSKPAQPFNGYYVGAELGTSLAYANQAVQTNTDLQYSGILFTAAEPFSMYSSMVRSAPIGSLFGGYGHTWDKFYLSGEVALSNAYYNMGSSSNTGLTRNVENTITIASDQTVNTQANVSPTQFGIFLRPGVLITPSSLLYGRIGTSVATLGFNTKTAVTKSLTEGASPVFSFPIMMQANKRVRRAAFQIGTGLEQAINEKLTIRLDYLYSYYGTVKVSANQSSDASPFLLTTHSSQSVSINDQSIMLGLAYHCNV